VPASAALSAQGTGPSDPNQIADVNTQVSNDWKAPTDGLVSFVDVMDLVDCACDALE